MEVEIISTQLIKPSIPTPHQLRYLQLSFLDQWHDRFAFPAILFYPKSSKYSNTERCNILKNSLSKALSLFYPLAGRVKDNNFVDCNDEGALFVEAKANCQLSTVLADRNGSFNKKLVPRQPHEVGDLGSFYQITLFDCGGLAVSFAMSHKLGDGMSIFTFIKAWAEIAKGNTDIKPPQFGFSTFFPQINFPDSKVAFSEEKPPVTKLFAFSASALAALKAKYAANYGEKLSSVEALTVFIWSRFMASTQTDEDRAKRRYKVFQWVNLRPRLQLPESKIPFGNLATAVEVEPDMNDTNDECNGIVKRLKDSMRNVSIRELQDSEERLKILSEARRDVVGFDFSSVSKFVTHEVDFGWGKPFLVGECPHTFTNNVHLCHDKEGKGIDAWIGLKEDDMAKFEADPQLLLYLSLAGISRM